MPILSHLRQINTAGQAREGGRTVGLGKVATIIE